MLWHDTDLCRIALVLAYRGDFAIFPYFMKIDSICYDSYCQNDTVTAYFLQNRRYRMTSKEYRELIIKLIMSIDDYTTLVKIYTVIKNLI